MTEHTLGDGPVEAEYEAMMHALAHFLDAEFNGDNHGKDRSTGFVLLVFPFNSTEGRCNYISNGADRRDVIKLFEEQLIRLRADPQNAGNPL